MKRIFYSLILFTAASVAPAQEFMTLQRARQMALEQNEDIKIAEATAQKSKYDQKAARTNYLPSVSAQLTGLYLKDDLSTDLYLPTVSPDPATGQLKPNIAVNPATGQPIVGADGNPVFNMYAYMPVEISLHGAYMAGVTIEQPLFAGGKIVAGNKMADIGVGMSKENILLKKSSTICEADKAYWQYVSVQSKVSLAKSNAELMKRLAERVQNSFDVGMVNRNEVLKVLVENDKAVMNLQKAQNGLELSRMSLCRVTGLSYDTQIVTDSLIARTDSAMVSAGSIDIGSRSEYKLMQQNIALEEQRIKTVRADYLPLVGVSAGYNYVGNVEINSAKFSHSSMNLMASVKIPLFNWTEGKQKISSAQTMKQIKTYELEKNAALMQLEIENAKFSLSDAALRVEMAEKSLLQAQENLRVSTDNYEVGRELLTDRLIAQTQWEQAANELIEAKTALKLQETEYMRVTASLLSE